MHIHDGAVHDTEEFDHELYVQTDLFDKTSDPRWQKSRDRLANLSHKTTIVRSDQFAYKSTLKGTERQSQ